MTALQKVTAGHRQQVPPLLPAEQSQRNQPLRNVTHRLQPQANDSRKLNVLFPNFHKSIPSGKRIIGSNSENLSKLIVHSIPQCPHLDSLSSGVMWFIQSPHQPNLWCLLRLLLFFCPFKLAGYQILQNQPPPLLPRSTILDKAAKALSFKTWVSTFAL